MHSAFNRTDVNERLLAAVHKGNYEGTLSCLMQGAKATAISYSCGRTAVGAAAITGNSEILQLLIQSCEEPNLEIFRRDLSTNNETEVDTTPDGMDCLEWEDEFTFDTDQINNSSGTDETIEDFTSLYYYYAKTFERTGNIVSSLENCSYEQNNCSKIIPQDPHTLDQMTMAPLHYAAFKGNVECVRILLEHGAKVDVTTEAGYTPLHLCTHNSEIALILLKYGANPNAKAFYNGETPFMTALKCCNSIVSRVLLQTNKININETEENDSTALMSAIIHNQTESALDLICRGAKTNLQDRYGRTALSYAVENNNVTVASRLLERGAKCVPSHYLLHQCVAYNMSDMLKLLLCYDDEDNNSLRIRNSDGFTPIQFAIIHSRIELLEHMLKLDSTSLHFEMDNDILLAVQYMNNLEKIKSILRILFAYGNCSIWNKRCSYKSSSTSHCRSAFCHTPLSRTIILGKLHIAEFLIKEGINLEQQICHDHVVNYLRSLKAPGCKEFTKLLVLCGYKFPQQKTCMAKEFSKQRQDFEDYVRQLTNQPLELKSLTRIKIRKQLVQTFCNSTADFKYCYHATNEKSTIEQMIEQLQIPKILQEYLINFYDCETVVPFYPIKEN